MPLVCEVVKNCKLKNNIHHPIPFKNVFNVNIFIRLSGRIYTDDYQWLPQGGWETLSVMFPFLWARITLAKEGGGSWITSSRGERRWETAGNILRSVSSGRVLCTSMVIQAIRARVRVLQHESKRCWHTGSLMPQVCTRPFSRLSLHAAITLMVPTQLTSHSCVPNPS